MTKSSLIASENSDLASRSAEMSVESLWLNNFISPRTKQTYGAALQQFIKAMNLTSVDEFRNITQTDILNWRQMLLQNGLAARTVNNRLSALSSVFKELADKQIVTQNPVSGIKRPKVNQRVVETAVMTAEQARDLIDAPERWFRGLRPKQKTPKRWRQVQRDKAILYTLIFTGCRISEVANLKAKDLFQNMGYWFLAFTIKGGARNSDAINLELVNCLLEYFEFEGLAVGDDTHIFCGRSEDGDIRKPLSRKQVDQIFNKYLEVAELPANLTPHSCRATFATLGLDNGVDLIAMQRALGHAYVSTTQTYVKTDKKPKDSPSVRMRI